MVLRLVCTKEDYSSLTRTRRETRNPFWEVNIRNVMPDTHTAHEMLYAGLWQSKSNGKWISRGSKIGQVDAYYQTPGNESNMREIGGHVVGEETSVGIMNDKLGVENKMMTGGVEGESS